jgi:hypothetical protein
MDEKDERSALLSAATTEHIVMQTAINGAVNEGQSRASMFIGVLSGAVVAMGFATQSETIFFPFVATVLPAVFVMGVFTVFRLVDIAIESARAEISIAAIRRFYRELGPRGAELFSKELGRWPEGHANPVLRLGMLVAYWTTSAAMIAAIDAFVGAATVALILHLGAEVDLVGAVAAGAAVLVGLLLGFHYLQKLRIAENDRYAKEIAGLEPHYDGELPKAEAN